MLVAASAVSQNPAADADVQNAQVQQYVQMLQPALWRELDFVRRVCDLTPEQRPAIKAAGDAAVNKAARSIFLPQRQPRANPDEAGRTIREALAEALPKSLTAEQLARYRTEDEKRAAAIQETAVLSAVSQIDGALYLTEEQREKIMTALNKNWQRGWEQWLVVAQYAGQYFPQVPDQHVVPHLTSDQANVWRGLQKVSIHHWGNNVRRLEDEAWWQAQEGAGPAAQAKKTAKPVLIRPPAAKKPAADKPAAQNNK